MLFLDISLVVLLCLFLSFLASSLLGVRYVSSPFGSILVSSGTRSTARMSSVIASIRRFFGLPHGQQPPGSSRRADLDTEFSSVCMTCPYHHRRTSLIFFVIGATPSHFQTASFVTRSRRVKPTIHLTVFFSTALRICSCFVVAGQRSAPYRATGHMTVFWILALRCSGILLSHRMLVDSCYLAMLC